MRIFLSLNPDELTKQQIFMIQENLKSSIFKINKKFLNSIKWEDENKFHLTLFFLGEVDEVKLNMISSALDNLQNNLSLSEIYFTANGINAFPKLRFPRVLYIDLKNEDKKAFELYEKINHVLRDLNFVSDKEFHPHITIGRVRRDHKINLSELKDQINTSLNFSVKNFYLMESKLTGRGSEYSVIKQY